MEDGIVRYAGTSSGRLILVKHAMPVLEASKAPAEWKLGEQGQKQAFSLIEKLKPYLPFSLYASTESKAYETAAIVAAGLNLDCTLVPGLGEIHRRPLPIMNPAEHRQLNQGIFAQRDQPVLGTESANQALARFSAAIDEQIDPAQTQENCVVVSHGTVIALFVEKHNPVDAFELWCKLNCASCVVLVMPGFRFQKLIA